MTDSLRVGLIDYEMGNLHSAAKALALQNCTVSISSDAEKLDDSDLLVLPGVGAFGSAMTALGKSGLDTFVQRWILEKKRPFLGICLGLQVLFDSSAESEEKGLGILKGRVEMFDLKKFPAGNFQIPHMGWNTLDVQTAGRPYFDGVATTDRAYFVHSFFAVPLDTSLIASTTNYGGAFCSSVATGRLFATQFHPEKSGDVGARLLSNVVARARKEKAQC